MSTQPDSLQPAQPILANCIRLREPIAQPELALGLIGDAVAYQDAISAGSDGSDVVGRFLTRFDATEDLARAVLAGKIKVRITSLGLLICPDEPAGNASPEGAALLPACIRSRVQRTSLLMLLHADLQDGSCPKATSDLDQLVEILADLRAWCQASGVNLEKALEASAYRARFERESGPRPH